MAHALFRCSLPAAAARVGVVLVGALLAAAPPAAAQPPAAQHGECQGPPGEARIMVTVTNVRSPSGQIAVTLYADDASRFLRHHGSLYVGRVAALAPVTRMCLNVPRPGTYALAVYHDANGNQKFDRKGLLGLPAEAYGFSNNPRTLFSLPSFAATRIAIAATGAATTIRLTYP